MLKYSLRKNQLTVEANDYMARVSDTRSYTRDEIIERIASRGSAMTRADIQAVLQMHDEEVCAIIADGGAMNTPLINSSLSITGVFKNSDDSFDQSRHTIHVKLTAGTLLKEALRKVRVEKVEASHTEPVLNEVTDAVSGMVNSVLSAGGVMRIAGKRLKFDITDEEQGIFLLNDSLQAERCAVMVEVQPSHVTAMIPAPLADGTYHLEVRTKLDSAGKPTKHLKTGRLEEPLTVGTAAPEQPSSV